MSDKGNELVLSASREGQLVQFDLNDVKGKVADQMRAFLLNMMPAEAFNGVIEVAFKKLTEPRPEEKDKYGHVKVVARPSELEDMVLNEMRKQLSEKVNEWGKKWKETPAAERARDQVMASLIDRAASGFVERVASQIVQTSIDNLAAVANTVVCTCNRIVAKNQSCPDCGKWNS